MANLKSSIDKQWLNADGKAISSYLTKFQFVKKILVT